MDRPANSVMLADGTVLENSSGEYSNEYLWCWISGRSMADCFSLFANPELAKDITVTFNNGGFCYKGFSELINLKRGTDVLGNETIDVCLTWPEGASHSIEEFNVKREEIQD